MSTSTHTNGTHYDVIVIGGGASGMMTAGTAAQRGKRVLLVEKNKVLGKKLSITGGGRCNITNAERDARIFLENYGNAAKFLHSPYAQFTVNDTFDFFAARGLPLITQARKRVFPHTQNAEDVTKVMKRYAAQNGVTIKLGTRVLGLLSNDGALLGIQTNNGSFTGENIVLATGGSSHQETGASSEGVAWLQELGHTTYKPSPDIVPLIADEQWVKDLSGTTLSFMKITFSDINESRKTRFSKTGKILFTHFGLSGPLILNAAHQVKQILRHGYVRAYIDLYPDTEVGTIRNRIIELFDVNKNKTLKNVLKDCVPHGMQHAVAAQLPEELLVRKVHSVTKEERTMLADTLKAMPLTITGTMGLDWAVISDGGVDLHEVDTKTMRSRLYDNLFLTGDVLHISRPSGGFSLQLCWTTGYVAGSNV